MRNLSSDPIRNFKFIVTIVAPASSSNGGVPSSIASLGFMSVDGFGIQNEVIAYREGGDNTTTRKLPGQSDFSPITFSRGAMSAPTGPGYNTGAAGAGTGEVYQWLGMVFSAMEGQGTAGPTDNFRTTITVDVLQHPITYGPQAAGINGAASTATAFNSSTALPIKMRFYVMNCWPMGMTWSGLDAGGNAIMVESLQIAHEGFTVGYATTAPGSFLSSSSSSYTTNALT